MDMGLIGALGGGFIAARSRRTTTQCTGFDQMAMHTRRSIFSRSRKATTSRKAEGIFQDDFGLVVGVRGSWVRDIDIFKISRFQWLILFLGELNCRGAM